MSIFSPIHHTFAPHVTGGYTLRSIGMTCAFWRYRKGKSLDALRMGLSEKFMMDASLFGSGRDALLALFRAMNLQVGEEIIIQGYTCIAVPNAIHSAGGVPVYVDIEKDTLNLDPEEVENAITHRTRAVICQHTFGIPSDTDRLRAICDKHKILLIEDCAHILPDSAGPDTIGRNGDAMMMSFGRDKAISGVTGGAVLARDASIVETLSKEEEQAVHYSLFTIKRLLSYPLFYFIARPLYELFVGKLFLYILKKVHLLIPVVTGDEKEGLVSPVLHRMPNGCAYLAITQWKKLRKINDHRRMVTNFYLEEAKKRGWDFPESVTNDLPLQKFPLFTKNARNIRITLKKKNIHLDDGWTGCVVCPANVDMSATNYEPGSDPEAEAAALMILNLPTHPTMTLKQAQRLVKFLDPLLGA